jgi:hypothetical protein
MSAGGFANAAASDCRNDGTCRAIRCVSDFGASRRFRTLSFHRNAEGEVASLREDIDQGAHRIAGALRSSGYLADFSPVSLWEIDRFFDEQTRNGRARRGGLLAESLGSRIFAVGAYTGEVIRRSVGGTWNTNDDDPHGELNVELEMPDGGRVWPVQRAMKRFKNGPEDGIAIYGGYLGVPVGQKPTRPAPKKRGVFR